MPGKVQAGHQQEFLHGKGRGALEGAAQGGLESPSLEVPKEQLDTALTAAVGIGHRLDSVVSEGFPTSWILGSGRNFVPRRPPSLPGCSSLPSEFYRLLQPGWKTQNCFMAQALCFFHYCFAVLVAGSYCQSFNNLINTLDFMMQRGMERPLTTTLISHSF